MALMQQVQIALVQTANVSSQQRAAVMLEQASVLPAGSQEQVAVLKQVQVMRSEAPAPSKAAAMMLELATFPAGKQRQQQQMLAMEQMHKEVQAQTESSLKLTKAEGSMPTRSHAVEERQQTSDAATMPPLPSLPPPDITFRDSESARGRTAMLSSDHPEKSILEKLGAIHAVVSSEKQKSYAAAAEQEARRIAELRAQAEVDMFRLAQLRGMEEQFRALPTSSAAESKQTTSVSVDAMLELSMTELAQRSLAEVEEGQRLALLRETTMRETTQLNALRERTVAEASRLIAMQESTAAVVAAAAAVRQSSSTLTPTASPLSSPPIRVAEVIVTGGSIVNLGAELEAALGLSMFPASRIFRTLRRFCNGRDPRLTGRVFMMAMHEASNLDPARPSPPAVRALAKLFRAIDIDRVGLVNILSVAGALVAVIPTAIVEQSSSSSPSSSSTECLTNMPESVLSAVLELADTRGDGTVSSDAMALFLTSVLTIKMMLNGHNPQRAYAVARETLDGETRLPRSFLSQHDFRRWFRDQIVSPQRRQIAMAQEEEPRRRSPWLKASQKSQLKKGQGQMGGRLKTNADSGGEPSLAASSPPHLSKQTALSRSTMMMGTTICTPLDEQCARYDAKSANMYAGLENGIPMRSVQRSQFRSSSSTMSIVGSAAGLTVHQSGTYERLAYLHGEYDRLDDLSSNRPLSAHENGLVRNLLTEIARLAEGNGDDLSASVSRSSPLRSPPREVLSAPPGFVSPPGLPPPSSPPPPRREVDDIIELNAVLRERDVLAAEVLRLSNASAQEYFPAGVYSSPPPRARSPTNSPQGDQWLDWCDSIANSVAQESAADLALIQLQTTEAAAAKGSPEAFRVAGDARGGTVSAPNASPLSTRRVHVSRRGSIDISPQQGASSFMQHY